MKKIAFYLFFFCFFSHLSFSQSTFPVNGIKKTTNSIFAFTHATIIVDENTSIKDGTLIISKGTILDVGNSILIPKNAIEINLEGKYIYPGFIDAFSNYGISEIKDKQNHESGPNYETKTKGAYNWNEAIRPETDASKLFVINSSQAEELRNIGFCTVNTHARDGIARGTSALVDLGDQKENQNLILDNCTSVFSFDKGSSKQDYPSSLMGAIALLRQTYLDAEWFSKTKNKQENNLSLSAFNNQKKLPAIFEVNDKYSILRADKIGDEFGIQYIVKTSGNEYQRVDEIKATNAKLIVPINFPLTPDVEDPVSIDMLDLEDMKHWEMAPFNLAILEKNNISFAITSCDLKSKSEFLNNLRKAIAYGLSQKAAIKALTSTPANLLNAADKLGALKKGYLANFFIASGNIFEKNSTIIQTWVDGVSYGKSTLQQSDLRGTYSFSENILGSKFLEMRIEGELSKPTIVMQFDSSTCNSSCVLNNFSLSSTFTNCKNIASVFMSNLSNSQGNLFGKISFVDGRQIDFLCKKKADFVPKQIDSTSTSPNKFNLFFPNTAYGFSELPKQKKYLITNATVWTNEKEGILKGASVLVENGKIIEVANSIPTTNTMEIIDAKGMHLTSGIIDEHSHIAISSGVNEGTHTSTSEVRIGDVINSDDINIYRQLSGGVTCSQLLHGSANAIGGQSAIIKLKWGFAPEKLKVDGADGFIKFALGENVKQSNWGNRFSIRYPQSRMGVEQVYYEYFTRAKEYQEKKKTANTIVPFRKDLGMEALVEILEKKRFITCHSYQQGEINMLMHVADSFGFKVNTFTHILEGYKVADKMKKHGVGASTFADWWAYKFEVTEAIPYNAAILTKMDVITAINSDDAEMGRRLNQEAAKSIKYGGLSQEEAWKLCTLNPAKLLHLDSHMGSIKVGKDADLVLWNDNPLSVFSKVKMTMIDGMIFYDEKADQESRELIAKEKRRIIDLMLKAKKGGEKTEKPKQKNKRLYHCDDLSNDSYMDEL